MVPWGNGGGGRREGVNCFSFLGSGWGAPPSSQAEGNRSLSYSS
jgi:hypothetical protein